MSVTPQSTPPANPGHPGVPLVDAEGPLEAPRPRPTPVTGSRLLLGLALVLIALNLRAVFSSVSALLPEIMAATGLGPGQASLMTTLPVLCMGVFAPLAPRVAARFGAERVIEAMLALLAAGTLLRGWGTVPALLAGATLAGAAIAIVNVLLPGLVKRDFPDRLGLMTGLFTMALSGGAAAAAGLTVPLRDLMGGAWPLALASWAVPALAALALWTALTRGSTAGGAAFARGGVALARDPLAWQVTLFMGLQSAMAYCVFGYLAPILRERGMPGTGAGLVVSWSVAMQCVACLAAPAIALRRRDQRAINVAFFVLAVVGFAACVLAPPGPLVWAGATLQGFGQGGLIALAMTAIVLRSPDPRTAAALSGMAQGVGYTLASGGPLLLGALRGWTGSYTSSVGLIAALALAGGACGYGAGRARVVGRSPMAAATQPPA